MNGCVININLFKLNSRCKFVGYAANPNLRGTDLITVASDSPAWGSAVCVCSRYEANSITFPSTSKFPHHMLVVQTAQGDKA
jgi:hypothetical protein